MKQLNPICRAIGVVSLAATLAMPLTGLAQGGAYFDDATGLLHLPEVDAGNLGAFSAKLQLTNADPVTFSIAELTPTAATGEPVAMYRAGSNRLSVFGAAVGSQFFNAEFANSATGFELQVDSLVEDTSLDLLNSAAITGNPTWNTVNGSLKQVSVGAPQHIWGTDSSDLIYRRDGNLWTNIGGNLKQVSVGCDGTVWGIQAGDLIFR